MMRFAAGMVANKVSTAAEVVSPARVQLTERGDSAAGIAGGPAAPAGPEPAPADSAAAVPPAVPANSIPPAGEP